MTDQPPTVDRGVVVPRGYEALAQGFATTVSDGNTDPAKRRAWVKIEFRGVDACAVAGHSMDYLDALVKADIAAPTAPAALDEAVGLLRDLVNGVHVEGEKGGRRSWSLRLQMASAYDAARAFLANLEPSQ